MVFQEKPDLQPITLDQDALSPDTPNTKQELNNLRQDVERTKELTPEVMEEMKTMTNGEFLQKYPKREDRLRILTNPPVSPEDIFAPKKVATTFTFNGKYNGDLWKETTAGQILPETAAELVSNGETYFRNGAFGEFFSASGARFTIHEGTEFSVTKQRSAEDIHNETKNAAAKYVKIDTTSETQETPNIPAEYALAYYATLWGMDPKFVEISFESLLKNDKESLQKLAAQFYEGEFEGEGIQETAEIRAKIEQGLTDIERHKVKYSNNIKNTDGRFIMEFAADIFYNSNRREWKKYMNEYGYNNIEIGDYNPSIRLMNDKIDLGEISVPAVKELFELIGSKESLSSGGFNAYNRGRAGDSPGSHVPPFNQMTIGEVMRKQSLPKGHPQRLFAIGYFQMIPDTFRAAVSTVGISQNERLTEENQIKLGLYLVFKKQPKLGRYLSGQSNNLNGALDGLGAEWAGLVDHTGKHLYGGSAGNSGGYNFELLEKQRDILIRTRNNFKISHSDSANPESLWNK
jgi:hypothetical protein